MTEAADFTTEIEPDLRAAFVAAAAASRRPAAQVMRDLMRDYVRRAELRQGHDAFLDAKVAAARASIGDGRGRANEAVEADFAARRAGIADRA